MTKTTELNAVKRFEIAIKKESHSFQSLLSNSKISPQRFMRAAVTALENSEGLEQCTPESVMKACKQAAQDGLVIDNKEAALVVFNKNTAGRGQKAKWEKQAAYIPMYQGLIKKALASSNVINLTARVVRENDQFDVSYGLDEKIEHKPNFDNPGPLKCAYAIARLADGSVQFEIMTRDEIMQVARSSKSGSDENGNLKGIWKQWEPEMWRKTVTKRLTKYLPIDSDEYNDLVNYDNKIDPIDVTPDKPVASQEEPAATSGGGRTKTAEAIIEAESEIIQDLAEDDGSII